MRNRTVLAFLVVLLFSATSAMAAGFRLPEQGAKAMGMGMAFVAQADDPSAIYYNPAGILQLEGQNVMIGGTYIRANGEEFTGTTPLTFISPTGPYDTVSETQRDQDFFLPNAYWTRKASPYFAYGVGVYVPFGLGQKYQNRDTSNFRNQVTNVQIQTFVVNPTIAWKVNDMLSLGVGIDFMYGSASLSQAGVIRFPLMPPSPLPLSPPVNIFQVDLDGSGTAWGYNFGILLVPSENWKVGFAYRSPFKLKIKNANVNVWGIDNSVAPAFGGTTAHTSASTQINMPATAAFGVAYIRDRLTVEADMDITFWSTFRSLSIHFSDNYPVPPGSELLPNTVRPEQWKDVVGVNVGAEYRVTDPLALRLGIRYDPTPVPADTMSPLLADADRYMYSAGAGYKIRNWTIDLSYMYVDKQDRTVNNQSPLFDPPPPSFGSGFDGTWSGDTHLVALDIGYKF